MPAEAQRRPQHLLIEDLAAGYGGDPVVADIFVSAGLGEIVAIVGPNGAGKSTLLKAITGRIGAMKGRVTLKGEDITNMRGDRLAKKGVGYVPQTNDVFESLTVAENLEMGGYLLPKKDVPSGIDRVVSIFPALGTMLGRTASKLSGGERKMVAMGRVLMLEPNTLILDEPTSNLSTELSKVVLHEHVPRLAGLGTAVLLVEQKALEALQIADWAHLLVAGRSELSAPARELLARPDIGEIFLGRSVAETLEDQPRGS